MKKRKRIYYTPEQKTVIWDRGSEMANHIALTIATDIQVYFCDPQSPWQ